MPLSDLGDVKVLLKRFKSARKHYEEFRSIHQDTYDFTAPQRETFRFHSPGQEKNNHVFDSTAIQGLEQFASRIKGSNLPSWKEWAQLTSGSIVPEDQVDRIDKLLAEQTKKMFSAINHSNFDTEINPALVDMGIGTGAIIIDEGEFNSGDALKFTNVPLAELYPEKPADGRIRSGWRKHKVAVGQITAIWPDAKIPEQLQKKIENDPEHEEEILNGQLYNQKDGMYYNVIIHEATKSIMFDQSFESQRLIVFRWHVVAGEVYGRGPAMQMLPDIRTLNKVIEFRLKSLALSVGGIYTGINDGIFNPSTVRLTPNTIIPVGSNSNQNPTLAPLQTGGDPARIEMVVREMRETISKGFFANPLGEISDPVRSATENMLRSQEMLKQAGASFGRLRSELIEPLLEAVVDILKGIGELEDIRVDGRQVTIKHTSPLAKTEDMEDFQATQMWLGNMASMFGPEFLMGVVAVEKLASVSGRQLGIDPELMRTEEEIEQIKNQAAEAAALAAEAEGAANGPV